MIKTLTRHGNSMALIIDRPILDLLNIDSETELELMTDGNSLIVSPRRNKREAEAHKKKVRAAIEDANKRYGKALKNLAK
ncbi:AbrB/MazE/SpoVT family DNA-binding domain-containing protein [bacterium]|nr:AbrB/MazE/SpoVT family DNA-binding domain-containing protein [bacterium]